MAPGNFGNVLFISEVSPAVNADIRLRKHDYNIFPM
jgi:hypothetical protein